MTLATQMQRYPAWPYVVMLVLAFTGFARTADASWDSAYERYGAKEGLASSEVVSVVEDHDGYLWAAAFASGVHRFDGRVFERFAAAKT